MVEIYSYAPCTAGEHMEQMYQQAYDLSLERTISTGKNHLISHSNFMFSFFMLPSFSPDKAFFMINIK